VRLANSDPEVSSTVPDDTDEAVQPARI